MSDDGGFLDSSHLKKHLDGSHPRNRAAISQSFLLISQKPFAKRFW